MNVSQGDVVWLDLPEPEDSAPGGYHPAVVIQTDAFNATRLNTTVVVMITSNLKYEALPGNVRLRKNECGLPKASVVNVTQIATIDRDSIVKKAGRLSNSRIAEVWAGVVQVLQPPP